ncbi:hypothetical protein ACRYCC_10030 [Actinomadura scrupuli]|uniref:hypothetical protein n=1 Tax=Actinomadura scrupuli TaxID=559629 RepID=UPI003D956D28
MRLLIGASVSTAFLWCSAALPASADPEPIDMNFTEQGHYGNGTHNRNIYSLKSPTNNHGYQHTSTSTAGGVTNIQNAMCKNVKVCNIVQQVTPKTETTPPNTTETVLPEQVQEPAAQEAETADPLWCAFVLPGAVSISALSPLTATAARKAPDAGVRAVRLPAGTGRHSRSHPHLRGHRVMSR